MLKGRGGYRMGHDKIYDHMMLDGLEDAYEPGRSMGTFGEDCAAKYSFTRAEQDAFAIASVERAKAATASGAFQAEITPVTVKTRVGETVVRDGNGGGSEMDMAVNLGALAGEAFTGPSGDVLGEGLPNKTGGDEARVARHPG